MRYCFISTNLKYKPNHLIDIKYERDEGNEKFKLKFIPNTLK